MRGQIYIHIRFIKATLLGEIKENDDKLAQTIQAKQSFLRSISSFSNSIAKWTQASWLMPVMPN